MEKLSQHSIHLMQMQNIHEFYFARLEENGNEITAFKSLNLFFKVFSIYKAFKRQKTFYKKNSFG